MPLVISDAELRSAGLSDIDAKIEFACRLFAAGKLAMPDACRFAGLQRSSLEAELLKRDLPLVVYTSDMLENDIATVEKLKERRRADRQ